MPDHVGEGQLPVERLVVVFGAVSNAEPIRLRGKEIDDLVARDEVGENGHQRRVIHFAIVSAFSDRDPGVVK